MSDKEILNIIEFTKKREQLKDTPLEELFTSLFEKLDSELDVTQ